MSSLLALPSEIHFTILSFLDCHSLLRVKPVNHHLKDLLEANKFITRDALLEAEVHNPCISNKGYYPSCPCCKCMKPVEFYTDITMTLDRRSVFRLEAS